MVPAMGPPPFPPMVPQAAPQTTDIFTALQALVGSQPVAPGPAVSVSVVGLQFQYDLTEDDLRAVFGEFGSVLSVTMQANGEAVVEFASTEEATKAVQKLHNEKLPEIGGTMRVIYTRNQPVEEEEPEQSMKCMRFDLGRGLFHGEPQFCVATTILGPASRNVYHIMHEALDAVDIRLRGIPSRVAPDGERLHLLVVSQGTHAFQTAVDLVEDLLQSVREKFKSWAAAKGFGIHQMMDLAITKREVDYATSWQQ
mmetsp:Transcript_78828/g.180334  ORF Transcript_78828/g.180334 Transcript_78828/m.180334 type:complete len:254 (+) Transcript_78828:75-836(+)